MLKKVGVHLNDTIIKVIEAALRANGVKGEVKVTFISVGRYEVELNDSYYGIFDTDKNTFVD